MRHNFANDDATFESPSRAGWRIGITLAVAVLCGLNAGQAQSANEYQVKAAYVYNFAKSAVWPNRSLPDGSSALLIGVVGGDDEFVDILKKMITGKSIGTHPILAERVSTEDELKSCRLIFLRSSAGRKHTQAAISAVASASVLLVGEDEGFLGEGGMINLFLKNGTVRFEVDRSSLDRANIHLSPELLALGPILNANYPTARPENGADSRPALLRSIRSSHKK